MIRFRDIVTLMELDEDEELLEDPNPAAGV